MSSSLTVKTIPITRMDCPTCIPVLEKEVLKLRGVDEVRGNYLAKTLKVTYDPGSVQLAEIEAAIERVGYRIAYKRYPGPLARLKGLLQRKKSNIITPITDVEFPGKVLHSSKTTVVLFSSPTCPTCKVFKPRLEDLAKRLGDRADFYEMDITETRAWRDYDILSIPTVLVFKAGEASGRFDALPSIGDIEGEIGS